MSALTEARNTREIAAVGGTWLGKTADMRAGNWDAIGQAVADAVALVRSLA